LPQKIEITNKMQGNTATTASTTITTTTTATTAIMTTARVELERVSEETLIQACADGDLEQLRKWGRDVRLLGVEPLLTALENSNFEVVRYLLEELGSDVNQADDAVCGENLLLISAHEGCTPFVRYIIEERGADVHQTDRNGSTCLRQAAKAGHLPVVEYLIAEGGASWTAADLRGAPLWYLLDEHIVAADDAELSSLLELVELLPDPHMGIIMKLQPQSAHMEIIGQRQLLKKRLPGHLKGQLRALAAHCLLPAVLHPLIARL
jgi:hypothetical protein